MISKTHSSLNFSPPSPCSDRVKPGFSDWQNVHFAWFGGSGKCGFDTIVCKCRRYNAGMFTHFGLKSSSCYFQHMVRGSHLVLYNTARIHSELMRPWVQCAFTASCVSPAGADCGQYVRRKPRYLYSGCHHYADSALNVILGLAFNFEDSEYTLNNFTAIFGMQESTSTPLNVTATN